MAVDNGDVYNEGGYNFGQRNARECIIYNMDTKQVLKCQFNPEDLPRTRSVNYANIVSPGMAYPLVQFVNGEAEDMDINLTFYNASDTSKLNTYENFLESLLPPKKNKKKFKRPTTIKFYYGNNVIVDTYVVTKKQITKEYLNSKGDPYYRTYTLSVRRVMH